MDNGTCNKADLARLRNQPVMHETISVSRLLLLPRSRGDCWQWRESASYTSAHTKTNVDVYIDGFRIWLDSWFLAAVSHRNRCDRQRNQRRQGSLIEQYRQTPDLATSPLVMDLSINYSATASAAKTLLQLWHQYYHNNVSNAWRESTLHSVKNRYLDNGGITTSAIEALTTGPRGQQRSLIGRTIEKNCIRGTGLV